MSLETGGSWHADAHRGGGTWGGSRDPNLAVIIAFQLSTLFLKLYFSLKSPWDCYCPYPRSLVAGHAHVPCHCINLTF